MSVTGQQKQVLKQQAGRLKPDTVLAGLDILVTARTRLRGTTQGRVVLEMALVRLVRLDDLVSLTQLAQWAASQEVPPRMALAGSGASVPAEDRLKPGLQPQQTTSAEMEKKKEVSVTDSPSVPVAAPLTQVILDNSWTQVISEAGFVIGNELRKAEVAISGPNALVLRFPAGYNHSLDETKLARLAEMIRKVLGLSVTIRVDNQAASKPAAAQAAVKSPEAESSSSRARRSRGEVAQLPLVKKAMDLLGAQIVQAWMKALPPRRQPRRRRCRNSATTNSALAVWR